MVWESVGFTLPCGSNVAGSAAGAGMLEALPVEPDLSGVLDAGLLPALLLFSPPVIGVDGVVLFPPLPDGEVILTVKQ